MKTKIITLMLVIFCSMFYGQVRSGSTTTTDSPSTGSGSGNGEYIIQLYPNPCTTSLTIKTRYHLIVSFAIYDEKGELKYNSTSEKTTRSGEAEAQINISAGKYLVTVIFDSGFSSSGYFNKADDQPLSITKIIGAF